MEISQNEIKPLLERVLTHYENRLKEIQNDQNIVKFGIDLINKDMMKNMTDVTYVKKHLNEIIKESIIPEDDRKILCDGLMCYISDLQDVIQKTSEKLHNIDIQFIEINQEIEKSREMKSRICHG